MKANKILENFLEALPHKNSLQSSEIRQNTLLLKAPKLDYQVNLEWQQASRDLVKEHKALSVVILCSHPFLFTMGRGLQKKSGQKLEGLKEFRPEDLPEHIRNRVPLHKINRGGGLTFHYPGQVICYPILNLASCKWDLTSVTWGLFDVAKDLGEMEFGIKNLEVKKDPLGLWRRERKYASLGIGIERFCTQHGIAVNIFDEPEVYQTLQMIHPCGLQGPVYSSFETLTEMTKNWDEIALSFEKRLEKKGFL